MRACKHTNEVLLMICVQSRLSKHRPGTFNAVCASIRGGKPGSYVSTCVTPSAFDPPAAFVTFTAASLRPDRYVFTVVAWNDSGKKVVLHDEFGIVSNSALTAEAALTAAPGVYIPTPL
jgi:hypothetical protein